MFDERACSQSFGVNRIELSRRRFACHYGVRREEMKFLDQAQLSQRNDMMLDMMVFQLSAEVLGIQREERSFSYPATWWDAFKLRWFPDFLRRHYPARLTVVRFADVYDLYPSLDIPGHKPVLYIPEPVRDARLEADDHA